MTFKISIIVPTHNSEKFFAETLDSLLRQTIGLSNFEVIMVNDCSTDGTGKIIDSYADKYDNFVAVHLSENSGFPGGPRNVGIKKARGKYLMFIDHDDFYKEEICEVLYNKIIAEDADLVSCRYMELHDDGKLITGRSVFGDDINEINVRSIDEEKKFFLNPPTVWTKIFRRSFLVENNILFPEDTLAEDVTFMTRVYLKANGIIFMNKFIGYYYSIRDKEERSTIFTRNKKVLTAMIKGYYNIYDILKNENKDEYFSLICKNSLPFWARQFMLSELERADKKELLTKSHFLFEKYESYGLESSFKHLNLFIEHVANKEYENAIMFSEIWRDSVKDQYNLEDQLKNQNKLLEQFENQYIPIQSKASNKSAPVHGMYIDTLKKIKTLEKRDSFVEDVSLQINDLNSGFYEMGYYSNNKRSITQRLISKFPSLYILSKWRETSLKNALINIKAYKSIKNNNLFDIGYYLKTNPDVRQTGTDPLLHYMYYGYKKGLKPNPTFDGNYYLKKHSDVKKSNLNPLAHYSLHGIKEKRKKIEAKQDNKINKDLLRKKYEDPRLKKVYYLIVKSGLFYVNWYKKKYLDIDFMDIDPIIHYLEIGAKEGRNPNPLFDTNWYLMKYPDVALSDINPLVHFIKHGASERRNPNPLFDSEWYAQQFHPKLSREVNPLVHYLTKGVAEGLDPHPLFSTSAYINRYNDVASSGLNPLIHYLEDGIYEDRKPMPALIKDKIKTSEKQEIKPHIEHQKYSHEQIDDILDALSPNEKITIIVHIQNVFENVKKCIFSIISNTKIPYELILIDNNSDKKIKNFLKEMEDLPFIKVIQNQNQNGFEETINNVIKSSKDDIVLINSNTIVTDKWLQKLVITAYTDKKIGTVKPLYNSNFSFAQAMVKNEGDKSLLIDNLAKLVEKTSKTYYQENFTINEPCIFIKRDTMNKIGLFDESFSKKASQLGLKNIVDDSTFIYQELDEKQDLVKIEHNHSNQRIMEIYNVFDNIIKELGEYQKPDETKQRILFAIFKGGGGTPQANEDLMKYLQKDYECFILLSESNNITLSKVSNNKFIELESYPLEKEWNSKDTYRSDYRKIYFNVLVRYKIDIIHIRHLLKNTFDLPSVSRHLALPVVLSFHDFYYVCPTAHLIHKDSVFCELKCLDKEYKCIDWIEFWRTEINGMLQNCNCFATTTESAKNIYLKVYEQLKSKEFKVIEHGRDFPFFDNKDDFTTVPQKDEPIKILIPGHIVIHKGAEFIKELKSFDKDNKLEIHFCGTIVKELEGVGVYHGTYMREELYDHIKKIKPSFIGIFSTVPETYCHTLSEAWACGVPVLASKMGALEERINKNGGGWFLDIYNPKKAYNEILRISEDNREYLETRRQASEIVMKSIKEMANEYQEIYEENLNSEIVNMPKKVISLKKPKDQSLGEEFV